MKLKQFVCKAASIAMCAMIIGTTVVSVNVKADTKATESTVALDTHDDDVLRVFWNKMILIH